MSLAENDQIEVYREDNRMCVVSYPSCPTFSPSPEDVSCFKFVADDMVASMRDDAERCLGNDIASYLNDRSFVTDRILSEKEKEMYE